MFSTFKPPPKAPRTISPIEDAIADIKAGKMVILMDDESRENEGDLCMAADRFFPAKAITKELDLTFVFVYRRRDFEIVVDLLGRGRIEAGGLVTDRVGFDGFCQAFEALKKPSDQIKVMLEPH